MMGVPLSNFIAYVALVSEPLHFDDAKIGRTHAPIFVRASIVLAHKWTVSPIRPISNYGHSIIRRRADRRVGIIRKQPI